MTDSMVEASAIGFWESLSWDEHALELIYSGIRRIREISAHITVRVIRATQVAVSWRSSPGSRTQRLIATFFLGHRWFAKP